MTFNNEKGLTLFVFTDADDKDYIPIMDHLSFAVTTGNRQCINVSLVNDDILEDEEEFQIHASAVDNSLVTVFQPYVLVTILNDDCKRS